MSKAHEPITRTPFKVQANVLQSLLTNNSMVSDDEKVSLRETIGALTWINQLQIFWAEGGQGIPDDIKAKLFEGRNPQKIPKTPAPV